MKTPIVLIIYHKPETTKKVIDSIREVKPKEIYIIADGPKNKSDKIRCEETRNLINLIDWKCKIHKNFSSKNMGLRKRIVSGLNWAFSKTERAIILEDDLKIDKSFYKFSEEMLEKYKNDDRVISVSGNNFLFDQHKTNKSYFFSRYVYVWGWATWRRAWRLYDDSMKDWPDLRKEGYLNNYTEDFRAALYWKYIFDLTHKRKFNSWAYCWTYAAFKNKKLSVVPSVNLVSNIGYGREATHTSIKSGVMDLPVAKMKFPIKFREMVIRDKKADSITEWNLYLTPRIVLGLIFRSLKSFINI